MQAHRTRHIDLSIRMLILAILISGLVAVFMYNQTVSFRHGFRSAEVSFSQTQVVNANFKNQLYSLLDAKHLISVAQDLGFIKDVRPAYLNVTGTASIIDRAITVTPSYR